MKVYKKAIFLFHRDLRLQDNSGLIAALNRSEVVLPIFIFEEKQVSKENNYRSKNALQFMIESLKELDEALKKKGGKLILMKGNTIDVLEKLIDEEKIEAVFSNRDYTPFALGRDEVIEGVCNQKGVKFESFADALINEPGEVLKKDGLPYTVYTPFFRRAILNKVGEVANNNFKNYYCEKVKGEVEWSVCEEILPEKNENIALKGGRKEGLKLISRIENLKDYRETRNIPSVKNGTTMLSAHNKFGTVSIREFYWKILEVFGEDDGLMREIYWRDFLTHIAFYFPEVFGNAFKRKYRGIPWPGSKSKFKLWCEGKTGFPLVDAGMRELNETGYMHNRVRMVVASFLVKDLHVDWQWGEKYFAQKLFDYDPAVNNGNWQWAASTGCDAQPYFRIFNPLRQQERFDKECKYIKKWVPELADVEPKMIHKFESVEFEGYSRPIVQHKEAAAFAKDLFKGRL